MEQFHQRGQGFNASNGRYTAPVSGFYQLTASLVLGESVHHAHVFIGLKETRPFFYFANMPYEVYYTSVKVWCIVKIEG